MLVELFMTSEHTQLIAKLQYFYDVLSKRREEYNLAFIENNNSQSFRQIRDIEEIIGEFKKTFDQNIYQEHL